jgi:glycosyltransferase involved in cell wall biosynthesis
MTILVIPSWYPPNGGMFFAHQTQWLINEGITATVIAVEEKSLKRARITSIIDDFRISRKYEFGICTYRKSQLRIPKLNRLNAWLWIKNAIKLTEKYILEKGKPDLIQAHSCMWGGYVSAIIKRRYGIPYVITEHRGRFNEKNYFKQQEILPWHYPLLKEALIWADAIIPVSEKMVSVLEGIAGIKLKCKPIPNPVDQDIFKPVDKQKANAEHTEFLNITNFLPYKAIDILIKAFYTASQKESGIRLHLAGDGPDRGVYEALVKKLNLDGKVFFHGRKTQEEVLNQIRSCNFLVLSSYNEGQPVSIGETILCGKPVICTDVVSISDLPEFAGYIVETGNQEALAEAMLVAYAHKNSFEASVIRSFALSRFSRNVVIAEIVRVMKSVVHQMT